MDGKDVSIISEHGPLPGGAQRERRWDERHPVQVAGRYRRGVSGPRGVTVRDISISGCRFHAGDGRMETGEFLTLRVDTFGPLDAHVAWRDEQMHGVVFSRRLHVAVLDHIRDSFPALAEAAEGGSDGR